MSRFADSIREFKNLRNVAFLGLLVALAVVLSYVASVELGPYIRVGFSNLPNQVAAYLFGPAVGAIFGGVLDVLKWILKPTGPFYPGFTISAIVGGLIYGSFLYKRKPTLLRVFLAQLCVKVFVNVGLNTIWLMQLYDYAVKVILPERVLSNLIMLPIDTAILYGLLKAIDRTIVPMLRNGMNRGNTTKDTK